MHVWYHQNLQLNKSSIEKQISKKTLKHQLCIDYLAKVVNLIQNKPPICHKPARQLIQLKEGKPHVS